MKKVSIEKKQQAAERLLGKPKLQYKADGSLNLQKSEWQDGEPIENIGSTLGLSNKELDRLCHEYLDRGKDGLDNPISIGDHNEPLFKMRMEVWVRQLFSELSVSNGPSALRRLKLVYNKTDDLTPKEVTWKKRLERWPSGSAFNATLFDFIEIHECIGREVSEQSQSRMSDCWVAGPNCCSQYDLGLWSSFRFPSLMSSPGNIISCPQVSILRSTPTTELPSLPMDQVILVRNLTKSVAKYMLYYESLAQGFQCYFFQQRMNDVYRIDESTYLKHHLNELASILGKVFSELVVAAQKAVVVWNAEVLSSDNIINLAQTQAKYLLMNKYPKKKHTFIGIDQLCGWIDFLHANDFAFTDFNIYNQNESL